MQHGSEPDAGAEVLGSGRDRDQGLGGDLEAIAGDRVVLIGNVSDRRGRVKTTWVSTEQEFGLAVRPAAGSGGGTLGNADCDRSCKEYAGVRRGSQRCD
jgi:hypothetical protein